MFRCFTLLIILLVGCSPAAYKRETNKRTHLEIVPYQRPGIHSARWEIEASLEGDERYALDELRKKWIDLGVDSEERWIRSGIVIKSFLDDKKKVKTLPINRLRPSK